MDRVILIDDIGKHEKNLEEFVYQKSQGGKTGLSKSDIKKVAPDERLRIVQLLEIFQRNPEVFEHRQVEKEKVTGKTSKDKGMTLTLEEAQKEWDILTDKELVSLSQKDWDQLPGNFQVTDLTKNEFL